MHITLAEMVDLVESLEKGAISPRQIRYLETFGVFSPRGRTGGHVRLYDEADVALACLIVQLRQQDVPMWVVKGILVHLGPTLMDLFAKGASWTAVLEGHRMVLVKHRPSPSARWTFDLKRIHQRASEAVRKLRRRVPDVTWAGWHTMPAQRAGQLMGATV